jgi:hypothetical protein
METEKGSLLNMGRPFPFIDERTLELMSFQSDLAAAEAKLASEAARAKRAWNWVAIHWFFFVPGAGVLGYFFRAITHG